MRAFFAMQVFNRLTPEQIFYPRDHLLHRTISVCDHSGLCYMLVDDSIVGLLPGATMRKPTFDLSAIYY